MIKYFLKVIIKRYLPVNQIPLFLLEQSKLNACFFLFSGYNIDICLI